MVEQLRAACPDLAVLFMSGFTGEFSGDRESRIGGPILMKPFTADAVALRVRELLDARAGASAPADPYRKETP